MTYRQIINYYEDGYGSVDITFIVSDTKDGLSSETFTEIDLVTINDVKKAVEVSTGVLSEDEATFEIEDIFADTEANINARTFILQALNASIKRFVAIHLHSADETASIGNQLFYGIIVPETKAEDLHWNGSAYTTSPAPIRKWSFTVRPLATQLLDNVLIKDIIDEIPASFWTTNASDRQAYYNDGTISSRFSELINLNLVIQKICEVATDKLADLSLGTYAIECPVVETNCLFRPTRYNNYSIYLQRDYTFSSPLAPLTPPAKFGVLGFTQEIHKNIGFTNILGNVPFIRSSVWNQIAFPGQREVDFFPIDDTDTRALKIGFDTIDNDNSPYVSQRVFFSTVRGSENEEAMPNELNSEEHKRNLCYTDDTTLTDWLFLVAYNFGFFLRFDYEDDGSKLIILFEPRKQSNTQTYLSDAISANLETNFVNESESEKENIAGQGFYWTAEGIDQYVDKITEIKTRNKNQNKLLFTVSPNFYAGAKLYYPFKHGSYWQPPENRFALGVSLQPHNFKYIKVSDSTINERFIDTTSLHTAIYMKVSKYDETNTKEATSYFTTAGQVVAEQNGAVVNYNTLAGYINGLVVFDKTYYKTQYSLTVPYLMQFSDSSTGANKDFTYLQLLNNIVIDGVTYKVVDITYNLQDATTQLTLHNSSRFNFADTISEMPLSDNNVAGISFVNDTPITNAFPTAFEIEAGNVVYVVYNADPALNIVFKAQPLKSKYEYRFGIALNNTLDAVSETEYSLCLVAFDGEVVEIDYLSEIGSVGDTVYLKATLGSDRNLTTETPLSYDDSSLLTSISPSDKKLWCEVGKIIETNKLLVNIKKWIIE